MDTKNKKATFVTFAVHKTFKFFVTKSELQMNKIMFK